jgi:hypothetical protein
MPSPIDLNQLTPVADMRGESHSETQLLREMLHRAETYIRSFSWCPPLSEEYFAYGVGEVVALFLFRLTSAINETDEWLWVVEGDLPSTYFVVDEAHDSESALTTYCDLMEKWCEAVDQEHLLDDIFPIDAAPTAENSARLRTRINFIRQRILPTL